MRKIHPAWIAVVITFFTTIATAGFRSASSVLIVPIEDAFGWSRSQISLAISLNVLLYGLIAPFAAALMERIGVRRVVMGALTLVASGSFLTLFMKSPWQLVLLWGVAVGVGTGSMALVFAATIVDRWFVKRRGLVTGLLTAAGASGQLVFLPLLSILASHLGWQSVSLTVGAAATLAVPMIFFGLKERPSDIGLLPYGADEDWQPPAPNEMSAGKLAVVTLKDASKHKDFWLLMFSFFVCGFSTNGLVGTHFIPAAHDHGMQVTLAAGLLALIGVFDVIGTLGSGWLTDRYHPRNLLFIYYFTRGLSLFLLPSILFSTIHPTTLIFVIFYGLDWVATVPPTILLCRAVLGPSRGTVIYGWVFAAHQIGSSIAALGAALIRVKFGDYAIAFYISGAVAVITAFLILDIAKNVTLEELRK